MDKTAVVVAVVFTAPNVTASSSDISKGIVISNTISTRPAAKAVPAFYVPK